MHLDRFLGDPQSMGDLFVEESVAQSLEHVQLARRQLLHLGDCLAPPDRGEAFFGSKIDLRSEKIFQLAVLVEQRRYHHAISKWSPIFSIVEDFNQDRPVVADRGAGAGR